jgi:cell division septation protein DedD
MINQKPKAWSLTLSALHTVMLLGLVTGSMAGAFYLGFSAGQRVGYESALQATQNTLARLPVPPEELDKEAADQVTSEVYAKLTGAGDREGDLPIPGHSDSHLAKGGEEIPDLAAIATTDTAPIPLPEQGLPEDALLPGKLPVKDAAGVLNQPEQLGTSLSAATNQVTGTTLGQALQQEDELGRNKAEAMAPLAGAPSEAESQLKADRLNTDNLIINNPASEEAVAKRIEASPPKAEKTALEQDRSKTASGAEKLAANRGDAKEAVTNTASQPTAESKRDSALKEDGAIPVKSSIPAGWYVQVAAPKNIGEANKLAATLKRNGFPVMIESAQVRGEDYYRVVVGPRTQRNSAEQLLSQIKAKKSVPGDPFVRAVK